MSETKPGGWVDYGELRVRYRTTSWGAAAYVDAAVAARMLSALRAVEWIAGGPHAWACPMCDALQKLGHSPACLIGAAIKAATSQQEEQ